MQDFSHQYNHHKSPHRSGSGHRPPSRGGSKHGGEAFGKRPSSIEVVVPMPEPNMGRRSLEEKGRGQCQFLDFIEAKRSASPSHLGHVECATAGTKCDGHYAVMQKLTPPEVLYGYSCSCDRPLLCLCGVKLVGLYNTAQGYRKACSSLSMSQARYNQSCKGPQDACHCTRNQASERNGESASSSADSSLRGGNASQRGEGLAHCDSSTHSGDSSTHRAAGASTPSPSAFALASSLYADNSSRGSSRGGSMHGNGQLTSSQSLPSPRSSAPTGSALPSGPGINIPGAVLRSRWAALNRHLSSLQIDWSQPLCRMFWS